MSPITIVLIATGILALILGGLLWHFVIWPSILENRVIDDFDDDEIPDQDELEDDDDDYDDDDDDDYDDDDDDEEYDEDDEEIPETVLGVPVKEPSTFPDDTITRLSRADWLAIVQFRRELLRDARPEFYAPVKEYREFWRAEASSYKMAVDIDRARYRKEMGLPIAA